MPRSRSTKAKRSRQTKSTKSRKAGSTRSRATSAKRPGLIGESVVNASPNDVVSFSIVCVAPVGGTVEEMRRRLSLRTVREFQPDEDTRSGVMNQLRGAGFEVFDNGGPVVNARGPVKTFTDVFGGTFVKRREKHAIPGSRRVRTDTSIELKQKSDLPSPQAIQGAWLVAVAQKPTPATPSLPPKVTGFNLHLPGDIAQLMRASLTHRRPMPSGGDRATGGGVTVAVLDTGFAEHPYYRDHGYRITKMAASDEPSDPEEDDDVHGTWLLSGLFACAPDVRALAIKYGENPVVALDDAMAQGGVKVISLSCGYDLKGKKNLPTTPDLLPLQLRILSIIQTGVTVVAASGNGTLHNFPAMMPEVIAVGGVSVEDDDSLVAWSGASSFMSTIYKGRAVPDVCGIASNVLQPIQVPGAAADWHAGPGGTSLATCQVAGIAALLLQKDPTLTPEAVRDHLRSTAIDVTSGKTATKNVAKAGPDLATGAGLVSALDAWTSVP